MSDPTIEGIWSSPVIREIGWILAHFLWQGAAAAILLAILLQLLRHRTANTRYVIACFTLFIMACFPVLTVLVSSGVFSGFISSSQIVVEPVGGQDAEPPAPTGELPAPASPYFQRIYRPSPVSEAFAVIWQNISSRVEPGLPWFVFFWLVGVFGLSCWRFVGWTGVQRLKRVHVKPIADRCRDQLFHLVRKMKVSRPVKIVESAIAEIPLTVGWLKPVIIIPSSVLMGLSPGQLEAIIAHELAHIRRHDYLINLLQTGMETLFFYHPAVWWVSNRMRVEREQACDDIAVAVCGDPVSYAQALTRVEDLRHVPTQLAMAVSRGDLLSRIRHVLNAHTHPANRSNVWAAGAVAVSVLVLLLVFAQESAYSLPKPVGIFADYADIGSPPVPGEIGYDKAMDEYRITASGRGSSGIGDELFYVYRPMRGSWRIEATFEWPVAPTRPVGIGLMCRESLDTSSKQVAMVYPGDMFWTGLSWRESNAGSAKGGGSVLREELQGKPVRCRLTRLLQHNQFIQEWYNPRIEQWVSTGNSIALSMREEVQVGIAASSGSEDPAWLAEGLARDVKITAIQGDDLEANASGTVAMGRRILPDFTFLPGYAVTAAIQVTGEAGAVKVEETPPAGWTIGDVSPPGILVAGKITWNLDSFTGSETLTYVATPPSVTRKDGLFSGKVGKREITGMAKMVIARPVGIFENHMDMGNPSAPGDAKYDANTEVYEIKGSRDPTQITYHFAYRKVTGNFSLKARVRARNVDATHPAGGAGLGVVDARKAYYGIKVLAGNSQVIAVWGHDNNWQSASLGLSMAGKDGQLEIVRRDDMLSAFYIDVSSNIRTKIHDCSVKLEESACVDLWVQSGDPGRYTVGYFEDVELELP